MNNNIKFNDFENISEEEFINLVKDLKEDFINIIKEINKVIVGYKDIIEFVLIALFNQGHVLLEGVPGLGKTVLVKTLSQVIDASFSRIQFTPDLMPADIIGTNIISEDEKGRKFFKFQKGPIFSNLILADEINRATPKTQSALLECMQERAVTVFGTSYKLEEPFLVLGTQNPIEMEGTYPLPEAQLDRFMFKLIIPFPSLKNLSEILERTTEQNNIEVNKIISKEKIINYGKIIKKIYVQPLIKEYISKLILATHPTSEFATDMVKKYVQYGSSPRGAQTLILCGKTKAILDNRYNVAFEDITNSVKPSLRHRIVLNFEGEAENISVDDILDDLISTLRQSPS